MRKVIIIILMAVGMSSCATKYYYAQVLQTKCANRAENLSEADPEIVYEDDNCIIYYETWNENGDGGFGIYNKTDNLLHVNLAKSFFIRNGVSYPYFKARTWSSTNSSSSQVSTGFSTQSASSYTNSLATVTSSDVSVGAAIWNSNAALGVAGSYGVSNAVGTSTTNTYQTSTTSFVSNVYRSSTSLSVTELPELSIAPKTSAWISEYTINSGVIVNCDLARFPEQTASMEFDQETSPVLFGNYITYSMEGSDKEIVVKNDFYVSKITNYALPSIFEYVERKEPPCQNVTDDASKHYSKKYPLAIYDKYLTFDNTNSFYVLYDVTTDNRLYKKEKFYLYSTLYEGYYIGVE